MYSNNTMEISVLIVYRCFTCILNFALHLQMFVKLKNNVLAENDQYIVLLFLFFIVWVWNVEVNCSVEE